MPYKSKAQMRWAHTETGLKALGGKAKVHEWDEASKGMKLPARRESGAESRKRRNSKGNTKSANKGSFGEY